MRSVMAFSEASLRTSSSNAPYKVRPPIRAARTGSNPACRCWAATRLCICASSTSSEERHDLALDDLCNLPLA